jgi:hypothetical protein
MKKASETDLIHSLLVWLIVMFPKGVFWRSNCGAVVSEYKGRKRLIRFGTPGMSDIFGVLDGKAIFIEAKSAKGRSSPAQIVFGESVTAAGALYIVARSIQDVEWALAGKDS